MQYNYSEEIKKRYNILDLLSDLNLKPNSSGFIHSIYNKDNEPSLKIYPATNSYFCFSSNNGGDLIQFYADYYKINYSAALHELGVKLGLNFKSYIHKKNKDFILPKFSNATTSFNLFKYEEYCFQERLGICEFEGLIDYYTAEKTAIEQIVNERKAIQSLIFKSLELYCTQRGFDGKGYKYLTGID